MPLQSFFPVDKLVIELRADPTVSSLLPGKVFDGKPVKPVDDTYATVRTISETRQDLLTEARLEVVVVGWDGSTPKQIREALWAIADVILPEWCDIKHSLDGFAIYGVAGGSLNWPLYNDRNRLVYTKDFLVSYAHIYA